MKQKETPMAIPVYQPEIKGEKLKESGCYNTMFPDRNYAFKNSMQRIRINKSILQQTYLRKCY